MWYSAHAIFYYKHEEQESFLVHENVYILEAPDERQALAAAEKLACENVDLNEDGHLEVNGVPAQYLFAGIRKLIEVETNPQTAKGELPSGTEVTYSVLEVDSLSEVEMLVDGASISVLYRE